MEIIQTLIICIAAVWSVSIIASSIDKATAARTTQDEEAGTIYVDVPPHLTDDEAEAWVEMQLSKSKAH